MGYVIFLWQGGRTAAKNGKNREGNFSLGVLLLKCFPITPEVYCSEFFNYSLRILERILIHHFQTIPQNIMTLRFPTEIILEILTNVPQIDIEYIHNRLPDNELLQPLLVRRMYENVVVECLGDRFWEHSDPMPKNYIVDQDELRRIARRNVPIQHIEIREGSFLYPWYIEVVEEHPGYFSKIPRLTFFGRLAQLSKFASLCLVDNLVTLKVLETSLPDLLPPFSSNLTSLAIDESYQSIIMQMPNLQSLELRESDFFDGDEEDLPIHFEILCLGETDGEYQWRKLFPALKKLGLRAENMHLREFHFPEGLVELKLDYFDFRKVSGEDIRFPSTLKTLLLRCRNLGSPKSVQFPSELENLTLQILKGFELQIHQRDLIEHIEFPHHLKELTLNVSFVAEDGTYIACASLPESLEYLDIKGIQYLSLPQGLKILKIQTMARLTQFPSKLEHLEYTFLNNDDLKNWYADNDFRTEGKLRFQFPSTLRTLKLGCCYDFRFELNLNLPDLERMELYNFCGRVPPLVKSLIIRCYNVFWDFEVPHGVRDLYTNCKVKEYPDSIVDLKIEGFNPRTTPQFPENLRYLTLYLRRGELNIKDLELPPSLYMLSGTFDKQELQEFNLRARKL